MGVNDRADAKKRANRKPHQVGESYDAAFRGYINITLSDEDKAHFEVWYASTSYWEQMEFHVSDGVNLSLKLDAKSGGALASGTQRRTSSPNGGLVVTARAKEAAVALARLVFILTILSHAERWEDVQPLASPDRW